MTLQKILAGLVAPAFVISVLPATPVQAEPLIWGVQAEQTEFRYGKDTDVFAWNFDALVGSDELKLVWRSEGEF